MIEILSRVDLNNPLQLRCVCKLWNSLIVDPQFVKNHSRRYFTEYIYFLYTKGREHWNAFRSQLSKNPMVPPEEENNDDDEDEEEEEDDAADADEEEDEKDASAEKGTWKHWLMNLIAPLENMLVEIRLLKKDLKTIKADILIEAQLIQEEAEEVAQLDHLWVVVRYIKRNIKTYRVNMQILEVRVKCLKRFLQLCLKLATSSSSHL